MSETRALTAEALDDMLRRFDDVPARFVVRNETTRQILQVVINVLDLGVA